MRTENKLSSLRVFQPVLREKDESKYERDPLIVAPTTIVSAMGLNTGHCHFKPTQSSAPSTDSETLAFTDGST